MRSGVARGIARGVGAACFLVLPVLLLGSWLGPGQLATGSSRAPSLAQARADFYAAIDETQRIVGGQWDDRDDPNSRGCVLAGGGAGRAYSALRLAPPTASADTGLLAAAWEDSGYTVEQLQIGPVTQLTASGDMSELLILRLSDRATTLQGESECRASE